MGPVESGERMIAKNGASTEVNETLEISKRFNYTVQVRRLALLTFNVPHSAFELLEASHEINFSIETPPALRIVRRRRYSQSQITAQCRVPCDHEVCR